MSQKIFHQQYDTKDTSVLSRFFETPHVQSRECTSQHSSAQTGRCPLFGLGGSWPTGPFALDFWYEENLQHTPAWTNFEATPSYPPEKTLCQGSLKRKGVPMGGVPKWCSGNLRVLFQWLISAQKEHADLCLHVWMILLIERSSFHQIVFHHRTIGWKTEFLLK